MSAGHSDDVNPVVRGAEVALETTSLVSINDAGVSAAAHYVRDAMQAAQYSPRTWRTHSLHMLPPDDGTLTGAEPFLNWMFLISALNFSFWSTLGDDERYAVLWRDGWGSSEYRRWTGYWSLVAALNRAIEEGIPITDPTFYASPERCSDDLIRHVFRAAPQCKEDVPLLDERIAIMREVGGILTADYHGSFLRFALSVNAPGGLTPLALSRAVVTTFPSFRDETALAGTSSPIPFWKRAQILTAETWAALYPEHTETTPHPLFPGGGAETLTMFADYRVPQILHHVGVLCYPPDLVDKLTNLVMLDHGCREEVSIRAGSIVAVERIVEKIRQLSHDGIVEAGQLRPCSVLVDFYLWGLAKHVESGEHRIEGMPTQQLLPPHRTRSIWY